MDYRKYYCSSVIKHRVTRETPGISIWNETFWTIFQKITYSLDLFFNLHNNFFFLRSTEFPLWIVPCSFLRRSWQCSQLAQGNRSFTDAKEDRVCSVSIRFFSRDSGQFTEHHYLSTPYLSSDMRHKKPVWDKKLWTLRSAIIFKGSFMRRWTGSFLRGAFRIYELWKLTRKSVDSIA